MKKISRIPVKTKLEREKLGREHKHTGFYSSLLKYFSKRLFLKSGTEICSFTGFLCETKQNLADIKTRICSIYASVGGDGAVDFFVVVCFLVFVWIFFFFSSWLFQGGLS